MTAPKNKTDLNAYRIDQLEEAVKTIGTALTGIDKSLEALTSLEARHAAVQESVGRAFGRLEDVEKEMVRVDAEFKKWFNRGVGVAAVASILFTVVGGYIGNEISKMSEAIKSVPELATQAKAQKRLNALMLRKMGIEPELLDID